MHNKLGWICLSWAFQFLCDPVIVYDLIMITLANDQPTPSPKNFLSLSFEKDLFYKRYACIMLFIISHLLNYKKKKEIY